MTVSDLLPFVLFAALYWGMDMSALRAAGWTVLILALLIVVGGVAVLGLAFGDAA